MINAALERVGILHQRGYFPVSIFSSWLASFDPTSRRMEIPGMYLNGNGDTKPFPELHDRLVGVGQSLLVMDSKQTPKRITFYGSSGREYKFLVKGGEDLRIDERIQLLFRLMNELLATGTDQLQARTFKVIPVTTETGLLEWVDNTAPLESLILQEMRRDKIFMDKNPRIKKDGGKMDWFYYDYYCCCCCCYYYVCIHFQSSCEFF